MIANTWKIFNFAAPDKNNEAKSSGQGMLFDFASEDNVIEEEQNWDTACQPDEEHPVSQSMLISERKLLGVYLTAHPLDAYENDVKRFASISIGEVETYSQVGTLRLVGIFTKVDQTLSKSGRRMAFITVEDQTGSFECLMFADNIPDEFPELDTPVVCDLQVRKRFNEETLNFTMEKITPLYELRQSVIQKLRLEVHVPEKTKTEDNTLQGAVSELKKLIKSNPGQTPMDLHIHYPEARVGVDIGEVCIDVNDDFLLDLTKIPLGRIGYSYRT